MQSTFATFRDHWNHLRELTFSFVETVPDALWLESPHPRLMPFAKQLRHVVCVQGVYQEGLATRRVDFARNLCCAGWLRDSAALEARLGTLDPCLTLRRRSGKHTRVNRAAHSTAKPTKRATCAKRVRTWGLHSAQARRSGSGWLDR